MFLSYILLIVFMSPLVAFASSILMNNTLNALKKDALGDCIKKR